MPLQTKIYILFTNILRINRQHVCMIFKVLAYAFDLENQLAEIV